MYEVSRLCAQHAKHDIKQWISVGKSSVDEAIGV